MSHCKFFRKPRINIIKVFIGSFWPYWSNKNTLLRDAIKEDLTAVVKEIADLPNSYHRRRVNDVAKRARNVSPSIILNKICHLFVTISL